ncbi:hypothetical protein N7456_002949 [Penicillium angulare]|uniref:Major facilitator superfamily (MFS) profile domain-containing protein n=1 Tax=Penicillium angulare TaxID=116970 RepID=A0A9W9KH26_9EURO|nr:hypothetical protein N7456_002949 [Penicillium angulare]
MDSESQPSHSPSWRSSKALVLLTVCVAMFTETLLFGFLVPILPYTLEDRLHLDPSHTQNLTSTLLSIYGLVTLISTPFVASWADRVGTRKIPLLLALAVTLVGTVLVAFVPYRALKLSRLYAPSV